MEKILMQILGEVKGIKSDVEELKVGQERLDKRMDGFDVKLDSLDKRLGAIFEQTGSLAELKSEFFIFMDTTNSQLEEINDKLNTVELITASNWKDIATLKSAK